MCLLPFLNKPLHIDDPLFVWTAQHITQHPLDFFGYEINWAWTEEPKHVHTQNPPLTCYYLALVGLVLGWSETALHLGMLPVTVGSTLGAYAVARLLCPKPALAALLALVMPAYLVSATSLMCDVMLIGFWCWAVFFWLLAYRRQRVVWFFVAAALISLGAVTKFYAIALIPLLLAYSAAQAAMVPASRRLLAGALPAMLVPLATLVGYDAWTRHLYGAGHLTGAFGYASETRQVVSELLGEGWLDRLFDAAVYPGGCVLPLVLFVPLLGDRRWLGSLAAAVVMGNALAWAFLEPRSSLGSVADYRLHCLLYSLAGLTLLALAAGDLYRQRSADSLLLLLWVVGTVVFASFVNWTTNARSVLPLTPAAAILVVRQLDHMNRLHHVATVGRYGWLLAIGLAVSLLVAWADHAHAAAERRAAEHFVHVYASDQSRPRYSAHWGFQYYMQQHGYRPIDVTTSRLSTGDAYMLPRVNTGHVLPGVLLRRRGRVDFPAAPLGSTSSVARGAGFYASSIGPLPFSLSQGEPHVYMVYTINVDGLERRPSANDAPTGGGTR